MWLFKQNIFKLVFIIYTGNYLFSVILQSHRRGLPSPTSEFRFTETLSLVLPSVKTPTDKCTAPRLTPDEPTKNGLNVTIPPRLVLPYLLFEFFQAVACTLLPGPVVNHCTD
jgi:hypothetical protein